MSTVRERKNRADLLTAILSLESLAEAERFFRDLCTPEELRSLPERWQIAVLLTEGKPYREIAQKLKTSTTTVSRVAAWLNGGLGGYRLVLKRLHPHHSVSISGKG